MKVEVTVTFPEGIRGEMVSNALVEAMIAQDYRVDGQLNHHDATIDGQFVITDTWENEDKLNAFLREFAVPAWKSAGLPRPDIKINLNRS